MMKSTMFLFVLTVLGLPFTCFADAKTGGESARYQKPGARVRIEALQDQQIAESQTTKLAYRLRGASLTGDMLVNVSYDKAFLRSNDATESYHFHLESEPNPVIRFAVTPLKSGTSYINFHIRVGDQMRVLAMPVQVGPATLEQKIANGPPPKYHILPAQEQIQKK